MNADPFQHRHIKLAVCLLQSAVRNIYFHPVGQIPFITNGKNIPFFCPILIISEHCISLSPSSSWKPFTYRKRCCFTSATFNGRICVPRIFRIMETALPPIPETRPACPGLPSPVSRYTPTGWPGTLFSRLCSPGKRKGQYAEVMQVFPSVEILPFRPSVYSPPLDHIFRLNFLRKNTSCLCINPVRTYWKARNNSLCLSSRSERSSE